MPQIHDALFLLLAQRVQPPRLELRAVRTQDGYLAERRLRTFVDDEYRQAVCYRKLPRGVTRIEIGSIARNALCDWILDDTSFGSRRDADRPTVYLVVAELIRATSKDELKGLLWRALVLGDTERLCVQARCR